MDSNVKQARSNVTTKELSYHQLDDPGLIFISGSDRNDFLQRQTTNDLQKLSADDCLVTVLTSAIARILDVLTVYVVDDDTLGVLTVPGRAQQTAAFLKQRIFFQDNVTVQDVSEDVHIFETFNPETSTAIQQNEEVALLIAENGPIARHISDKSQGVFKIIIPSEAADRLSESLRQLGIVQMTEEDAEKSRVERGIPGKGELTDDYTPLETNLRYAVADAKGCYTGQEVIARQITYDKVTRSLVGIRLDRKSPVGSNVTVEGRNAGTLTSVVESPTLGHIGLAIVSMKHAVPGTEVQVHFDGEESFGQLSALPFTE